MELSAPTVSIELPYVNFALDIFRQRHLRWLILRMKQQAVEKHCQLADMQPSSFH
jgi:hypothetical protein